MVTHIVRVASLWALAFAMAATVFASRDAHAANIQRVEHTVCNLSISGPIVAGDFETFDNLRRQVEETAPLEWVSHSVVCLDSSGGSVFEGLLLAQLFYDAGVQTYVEADAECLSICAVMFMMGRVSGDEHDRVSRTLEVGAQLGFHRPRVTLDEAMIYTSQDMADAYDFGIDASFRMMELATLPHPNRSTEMIPAELMARMLETPPDLMTYVTTIGEALAYDIQLSGVAVPSEMQLRLSGGYILCENAIRAWEQRGQNRLEFGPLSNKIFSFSAPNAFSIARVIRATNGERFPSGAYQIDTPRHGYTPAECGVSLGTEWVHVCVYDGWTGLRIGNCAEEGLWSERFPAWAVFHPSTDISAIGTQIAFDFEAVQWTLCSLDEAANQLYWGPCYHAVRLTEFEGNGWTHHVVVLPDFGTYEAFLQGERHEETASAVLAGEAAERADHGFEPLECLVNSLGLRLCVLP